jgi:sialic acid synthase SpsE
MVEFIAEVSSNHNGDLNRCFNFIEQAKSAGCDGVKFQLFKIDKLFAPEILNKSEEHRKRKEWELSEKFLPEISRKCKELGIKFVCTPFYLEAVDELEPYVDAYKIASYELLWQDLFRKCAETGKPVIFSTGMATMDEVKNAFDALINNGCKEITILQCTSSYPTPPEQCNLSAIETMRKSLKAPEDVKLKFGWSDHSVNEGVIFRAIDKWDVKMVEFHFDLDEKGAEFKFGHCWLPDRIKRLIEFVKDGFMADGDGIKAPQENEREERFWRADPSDGLRPFKEIREKF